MEARPIRDEFVFMNPRKYKEEDKLPRAREYAWDYDNQCFKFKNGKFYFVYDNEAIKIWLWKLFKTPRFWYAVFDGDYGEELHKLIGRGYTQGLVDSEAKRYVEEAIKWNLSGYVKDMRNMRISFEDGTLTVAFVAITPYSDFIFKFSEAMRYL